MKAKQLLIALIFVPLFLICCAYFHWLGTTVIWFLCVFLSSAWGGITIVGLMVFLVASSIRR